MATRSSKDLAEASEVLAENEETFSWPDYCTQMQIRYTCGHTIGGEFVKCRKHLPREDDRCAAINIQHVEAKLSPHKCRNCLHTPDR
ncbi:hypothetical protein N7481_008175 [Penicillium waksmanii]|uniref:uncharacterized protein n=1 Tax=Penicillium waksmanii TaxID=69791 RepID=UPI0025482B81|nr:uncharacterized protein N7481_008175 [Penicillium waksmanii]KAJ5980877.1 hypothetical protein N7481_008175 [Penicillium waksmanii]